MKAMVLPADVCDAVAVYGAAARVDQEFPDRDPRGHTTARGTCVERWAFLLHDLGQMTTTPATILLVDDDHSVRRLVVALLTAAGFAVTEAASGHQALDLCVNRTYDLLVTDVKMPGLTGIHLAKQPACQRACRAVLFISGCSTDDLQQLGLEASAHLLRKPFRPVELIDLARMLTS